MICENSSKNCKNCNNKKELDFDFLYSTKTTILVTVSKNIHNADTTSALTVCSIPLKNEFC